MTLSPIRTALLAAAALLPAAAGAQDFVRVGGGLAGTYPIFAAKLVELINENVEGVTANVVSGDIEKSLLQIESGDLDVALAPTFTVKQIADGNGSLGMPTPDVRHLMTLYGSFVQPVAREGGVETLSELGEGEHRVWMGQEAGFFAQVFEPMLEAAGVTVAAIEANGGVIERYGYLDEVQGFQDGRLDAGVFGGPVPYGLLMQIEDSPGFQLVAMGDEALSALTEALPGMGRRVVPAGTYEGQEEDLETPYYVNQLVVSAQMPDDRAYRITQILYENVEAFHGLFPGSEEIDREGVAEYNEIPVHPGAQRFFEEVGAAE